MDPNQDQYINDPAIMVLNICRQVFEGYANKYLLGMPSQPLTDLDYPAVIVQKMTSSIDIGATQTDDESERIVIMIFSNKADQVGGANDPGITTMRQLENMIEGKVNSSVGVGYQEWQPSTLVYQLRKQYTLNNNVIKNAIEISYDTTPRTNENGVPTTAITSAMITMTFTERIIVVGRT